MLLVTASQKWLKKQSCFCVIYLLLVKKKLDSLFQNPLIILIMNNKKKNTGYDDEAAGSKSGHFEFHIIIWNSEFLLNTVIENKSRSFFFCKESVFEFNEYNQVCINKPLLPDVYNSPHIGKPNSTSNLSWELHNMWHILGWTQFNNW